MENQKFDSYSSDSLTPIAIAALKQQWRLRLKLIRQETPLDRRQIASIQACEDLSRRCQQARFVLSFASFGTEIDLWPFNRKLAAERRLVLPLMLENGKLQLFQVTDFNQLERHHWGMLEPKISECTAIDTSLVEIALIPGLGFDLNTKYRLGYGGGYYDRLLASISSKHVWGIGFLEQAVDALPYTSEDISLEKIYLF